MQANIFLLFCRTSYLNDEGNHTEPSPSLSISCIRRRHHRYWKSSKVDCIGFVMCLLLAPVLKGFFSLFFAAAINSTNKANKAGGACHKQSILRRCLWLACLGRKPFGWQTFGLYNVRSFGRQVSLMVCVDQMVFYQKTWNYEQKVRGNVESLSFVQISLNTQYLNKIKSSTFY